MNPRSLFALLFFVGGILGVLLVRGFFLDPLEEIGWRLFWGYLFEGHLMDINLVFQSATFAKCVVGFAFGGLIAGFIGINIQKNHKG